MPHRIVSVRATAWFDKWARKHWTVPEYEALRQFLAAYPEVGPVIPGTGGARKVRWAVAGRGKRGGARVVYVYFLTAGRLYLLSGYTKNEKANLSAAERAEVREIILRLRADP